MFSFFLNNTLLKKNKNISKKLQRGKLRPLFFLQAKIRNGRDEDFFFLQLLKIVFNNVMDNKISLLESMLHTDLFVMQSTVAKSCTNFGRGDLNFISQSTITSPKSLTKQDTLLHASLWSCFVTLQVAIHKGHA